MIKTTVFKCLGRWWNAGKPPKRDNQPIYLLTFDPYTKSHLNVGIFLWGKKERAYVEAHMLKNRQAHPL
jgi:hypothetical protein